MKKDVAHNVEYNSRLTQKLLDKFNNIQENLASAIEKKIWMSYKKVFCNRNFEKNIVIIVIHECNKKSTRRDTNFYCTIYYIYQIGTYRKECYDIPIVLIFHFITKKPSLHDIIALVQRYKFPKPLRGLSSCFHLY